MRKSVHAVESMGARTALVTPAGEGTNLEESYCQ